MKKVVIGIIAVLVIIGVVVFFVMRGNNNNEEEATETVEAVESTKPAEEAESNEGGEEEMLTGKHNIEIVVKDYGTIAVELDADVAPITVTNFIKLVNQGFYDGLTFHRIISGFMIQGGDPNGNGTGGSDENIKGEFASNGVENSISHERGVISMARSSDPDSASSQFFIMHDDGEYLDGNYAAFGHVTGGIEIVDQICEKVQPIDPQSGSVEKADQPVIESIKVVN